MKQEIMGAQQLQQMLTMMESNYKGSTLNANRKTPASIINAPDSGVKPKDTNK
jgi:hypothetical protein